MKFSTVIVPLAAAMAVSAAPTPSEYSASASSASDIAEATSSSTVPTDGPLPNSLPDVDVTKIISISSDLYPIGISNGTHYFVYLVDASSISTEDTDAESEATATASADSTGIEKRAPRWIWWKPFPGEPAWKKRDAMPEAEANPRWIWWKPFPGEPAW
ncbi:uncharacterized protein SAPINGB_P000612 [Magnusiomyces paraingens]|uniref:Mating factor alpha n=1 Tax=Magnusiomyces paraingens TaxID=2606893 RepID=A0A5E8B0L2_9ASCO|nr:uncharacterized protein SAPINGB_P000612 [Saprochaete ingens]VVT45024.1 unnamed protein product [Saprochaete ingens]